MFIPPQQSSAAADAGTGKHSVCEKLKLGVSISDEEFVKLWGCEPSDVKHIRENLAEWMGALGSGFDKQACELPVVYDVATDKARVIPNSNGHRDYSTVRATELPSTQDLVAYTPGKAGLVIDYKTGLQADVDPAATNRQLANGALALARLYGLQRVTVGLAFVADDGTMRPDMAELDELDIEAFAQELRELVAKIPEAQPTPGPWCKRKWCNAFRTGVCPAQQQVATTIPKAALTLNIASREQAADVFTGLELAEEYLKSVKAALDLYVRTHGAITLADGSSLDLVSKSRETLSIDGNRKAIATLQHYLGDAFERAVTVSHKTSKEAIKAATSQLAKGRARTALEREILEALQTDGAVKVGSYETVEVVKAKKAAA